ncbi:hypothetical protein AAFF_G00340830 [Aldrovandia affinis]|uniref:Uncharacterized protein n=1 Tax=Aldrovandia affinis TaxID=143900 RepID=A0AAD7WPK1_9TELE|nr:hypothetical protein AAFF_G00340830 [Aldrovandia affinis]
MTDDPPGGLCIGMQDREAAAAERTGSGRECFRLACAAAIPIPMRGDQDIEVWETQGGRARHLIAETRARSSARPTQRALHFLRGGCAQGHRPLAATLKEMSRVAQRPNAARERVFNDRKRNEPLCRPLSERDSLQYRKCSPC